MEIDKGTIVNDGAMPTSSSLPLLVLLATPRVAEEVKKWVA